MRMKLKLVIAATCLAVTVPALAQVAVTPSPSQQRSDEDQARPRRGYLTPEEEQFFQQRQQQREQEQPGARLREPDDYTTVRQYEGRASFSGSRPGKCPLYGSVRASLRGNQFDASLTFPIERDAVHGYISGSRMQGTGNFGYSIVANVSDVGITGTATKKQQITPTPEKRTGAPLPFIPGPTATYTPPPPKVQDCAYTITLSRVS
jgi:hypothetical protein